MPLIEKGDAGAAVIEDRFRLVADDVALPESGCVLVSFERFVSERASIVARPDAFGVWLSSDQSPDRLAKDLDRIALIALDFPIFSDGRAYSSARLLRERLDYEGELRAIGDVLCEQLGFMLRSGFDSFDMKSENALAEFTAIANEVRVVYQPTGDGQSTAIDLRKGSQPSGVHADE